MESANITNFGDCLRYVKPYRARLSLGVIALAVVGLAEGLIALMITPMLDRILNPASDDSHLPLVKLPASNHVIYLNSFLPHSIHYVGTIFSIALVLMFLAKAIAEYFGVVEIQYVGQAAITDLRNDVYEKLVRQPIGFFQRQPTGRLMSAVINDVERARGTLSESLALFFRYVFTLFFLVSRAAGHQLADDAGLSGFRADCASGRCRNWANGFADRRNRANRSSAS